VRCDASCGGRIDVVSIVGTTVKAPEALPAHLVVDEQHTWLEGEKVYLATTAACGCVLGARVTEHASAQAQEQAYGVFAAEPRAVAADYSPKTVCADGWDATTSVGETLFPIVTMILCFLHSIIKIRDRCMKTSALGAEVLDRSWHAFHAATRAQFGERIRRFRDWATSQVSEGPVREAMLKLCSIYAMRYIHATRASARLEARAMALVWNFHPYCARTHRASPARRPPSHDPNGFQYHDNWLHNLLIAASLGGRRTST
jgi:hypothetical protein